MDTNRSLTVDSTATMTMKRLRVTFKDLEALDRAAAAAPVSGFSIQTEDSLGWNEQVLLVLKHPTSSAELELIAVIQGGTAMDGLPTSITALPTDPDFARRLADFRAAV